MTGWYTEKHIREEYEQALDHFYYTKTHVFGPSESEIRAWNYAEKLAYRNVKFWKRRLDQITKENEENKI